MGKLILKYQSLPINQQAALQSFINKKNGQEIDSDLDTRIIGIFSALMYLLIFAYIYGSAMYKGCLSTNNFTMSLAFKCCEKRIATILILANLCIFQFYLFRQNMYSRSIPSDYKRNLVVAASFVIVTAWLLLFFIWPESYKLHSVVALVILFFTAFIAVSTYHLYADYYEESGLVVLKGMAYTCLSIYIATLLVGLINFGLYKKNSKFANAGSIIFGSLEILIILSFCIFLVILSTLPPLPNKGDLVCFMNE
jgi:hypothetical protein